MIATTVTLLTLTFGSLSAYTVGRPRLRWVAWLMNLNLVARFVPVIVVMIPLYVTFRQLGLLNSIWGVVIALNGFLLPYGLVILAPYFATVPRELEEAARHCQLNGPRAPFSGPARLERGSITGGQRSSATRAAATDTTSIPRPLKLTMRVAGIVVHVHDAWMTKSGAIVCRFSDLQ